MSPQKQRKRMDDAEALGFVFGSLKPESAPKSSTPEPEPEAPKPKRAQKTKSTPEPEPEIEVKATPGEPEPDTGPAPEPAGILDRILAPEEGQERMIRFTADLPESLHRKLTMLAARSGKKKVELIRAILEEILKDVDY